MYLKRFTIEAETKLNNRASFIGEHPEAKYLGMSTDTLPRLLLSYKVSDAGNSFPDDEVNVEEFIGIKSYKAKGKRLSTREIESWQFLEPFQPEPQEETDVPEPVEGTENEDKIEVNPADVPLEIVETKEEPKGDGIQMDLFDNV
jgi:topoisomerase-4 subunit A